MQFIAAEVALCRCMIDARIILATLSAVPVYVPSQLSFSSSSIVTGTSYIFRKGIDIGLRISDMYIGAIYIKQVLSKL